MIFRLFICCLLILISLYGAFYWHNNGENFINNLPIAQAYGQPLRIPCHVGEKMSETNSCSFGQTVMYIFPYFFCLGLIAISVAVIYSSCRTTNCWGGD